jgi:RNA polymerase sigma-70 factor (ECF subfamily)
MYSRHAPGVYRYALALLGSPADAEEVTQTTFLNAYRAIDGGERPRSPDAWLHSIALNLCRQRFRQAARRPSEVPLQEDVAEIVPDEQSPTLSDVTRALKHLPFNQRTALVMREFEGLSPPRIAEALNVSASAVETLLFRARRNLREQLEGSLTCQEAERAISLQLDGLLPRGPRGHPGHARSAQLAEGTRAAAPPQRSRLDTPAWVRIPRGQGCRRRRIRHCSADREDRCGNDRRGRHSRRCPRGLDPRSLA